MGEPEHMAMHNYAYHPSVANWVQSTSLATHLEPSHDDPAEPPPDDFYKFPAAGPRETISSADVDIMTSTRQRQASNGAISAVSAPKASSRTAPSPSHGSRRTTPQLPANRPTVKSLAQKFNQPSSTESSPSSTRNRPPRPHPTQRSVSDTRAASSPSRPPAKEPAYGPYKFKHLKPRERPQPAPESPGRARRDTGSAAKTVDNASATRRKPAPASGTRRESHSSAHGRQPFFGEVIGEHSEATPGFGIPTLDSTGPEAEQTAFRVAEHSTDVAETPESRLPSESSKGVDTASDEASPASLGHSQPVQVNPSVSREARRQSLPSRIPVASRRLSAASDSSSSTRSYKASSARPPGGYKRSSPVRTQKPQIPRASPAQTKSKLAGSTRPSSSYRDYRERGKSPKGTTSGTSLTAVITATPQPPSPRLRNSRERQLLPQGTPDAGPRAPDLHDEPILDPRGDMTTEPSSEERPSLDNQPASLPQSQERSPAMDSREEPTHTDGAHVDHVKGEVNTSDDVGHANPLTLQTDNFAAPHSVSAPPAPTGAEFGESPVLGMPGSFMATPPMRQETEVLSEAKKENERKASEAPTSSGGELLQPLAFQPSARPRTLDTTLTNGESGARDTIVTDSAASELGIRESIPIMLGADEAPSHWGSREDPMSQSPLSPRRWRAEPLDASGTISYLEEDDSPIDPFAGRGTLGPDDSASVAFYNGKDSQLQKWPQSLPSIPDADGLTLDTEAYRVINKVLDLYHKSPEITPEVAHESRMQIQQVSPIIAQHQNWYSKDATETFLARLLSDANRAQEQRPVMDPPKKTDSSQLDGTRQAVPAPEPAEPEDGSSEAHTGGTAIIFPSESRRYSRGSRGSHGSTATTIWDDTSRADSSSAAQPRDASPDALRRPNSNGQQLLQPTTYSPAPYSNIQSAPQGLQRTQQPQQDPSDSYGQAYEQTGRLAPSHGSLLPEIKGTGEGLGLSLHDSLQQQQQHQRLPEPRPGPARPRSPAALYSVAPQPLSGRAPYNPQYSRPPSASAAYSSSGPVPQPRPNARMDYTPGASCPDEHSQSTVNERDMAFSDYSRIAGASGTTGASNSLIADNASWNSAADTLHNGVLSSQTAPYTDKSVDEAKASQHTNGSHHPAAFPGEDEEAYTRRLQRRFRILEELVTTENTYLSDLMVISQIWLATSKDAFPSPAERSTVFSNIEDIADFDNQLLVDLKQAFEPVAYWKKTGDEPEEDDEDEEEDFKEPENPFIHVNLHNDDQTSVGYVLKTYLSTIETLYTRYLLNHERASKVISSHKKRGDDVFLGWQTACAQGSKDITDAWDLDSLLVKPVQRLLKYPLLLQTLKEVTPPTHDDYADIEAARQGIIDISNRINDLKKRQETLRIATREGRKERKKGFRGIDIVKALTSKEKTKSTSSEFVDTEYDQWAQKFGGNFFQIQIIIKDMENYRDEITTCFVHLNIVALHIVSLLEEQPSSKPEVESTWRRNAMALLELRNVLLEEHKQHISDKILEPLRTLWGQYVRPQKLMEQRKKGLALYIKYKQGLERKEKIDPKLEDAAQQFLTVNDALKEELPKLYDCTKRCVRAILRSFIMYQKDWWKSCQKKILPLLEHEPEHTTSFPHDMRDYVARFYSDWHGVQAVLERLAICNGNLLHDIGNFQSPQVSLYADDSSRKSTSRRTESMGSEISSMDHRNRRSGGYPSRRSGPSFEGPPRSTPHNNVQLSTHSAGDYPWELPYVGMASHDPLSGQSSNRLAPTSTRRDDRAISPASDRSETTVVKSGSERSSLQPLPSMDDALSFENVSSGTSSYMMVPSSSTGSSSRASAIFNSALPMESANRSAEELPGTPADPEEPEVLFLAASLFEFNIAHDRREGGIPYLVYVPGEIFDVIGMKGELWLARNQDDPTRTVGWIWEKHFARILPEET